jgi:hypothetical protein
MSTIDYDPVTDAILDEHPLDRAGYVRLALACLDQAGITVAQLSKVHGGFRPGAPWTVENTLVELGLVDACICGEPALPGHKTPNACEPICAACLSRQEQGA